jgi:Domain of unknown function (DUF4398)
MADQLTQRIWPLLAILSVLTVLTGCASAPVQEMSNARQAIRAARDAGAEKTAPDAMREAQALLSNAEENIQKRMYRSARHSAVEARAKAAQALESAQAQKKQGAADSPTAG